MEALISARARDGEAEKCMEALMSAVARECGADPASLGWGVVASFIRLD